MIDIKTLQPEVQTILRNDPFIFKAANGRTSDVENLSAIVKTSDVTEVVDVLKRHEFKSGYYPYYFQHTELFKNAQILFESIFGLEPDMIIYSYKADCSISVFLFANKSLIEKSISKEEIEINISDIDINLNKYIKQIKIEGYKGIKVNNINVEKDTIKIKLPSGVFPVIGALNSIDSGFRTPNFNLIFGSEYLAKLDYVNYNPYDELPPNIFEIKKVKKNDWISNVDEYILSKYEQGISLYSIDKFDFRINDDIALNYDPNDMTLFYKVAVIKAKFNFIDTIVSFLLAVNRGQYLPLTNEQFSSFIPHFYGYDRLYESVDNYDTSEKRKLKYLYDTSLDFSYSKMPNVTCKNFIDYFLRDSIINFENLISDPGKEILKAFQTQPQIPLLIGQRKEMLSRFIDDGLPNQRYDRFLNSKDGQVEAKNKIYPILRNI